MTTKTKKPTKRIIIDYTQNLDLEYILSQLEQVYFSGLSKSEITKLALINLFKTESKSFIPNLTEAEEESLAKAMEDQGDLITLKTDQDIINFTKSLED